jgi:hypothetical protein
VLDSPQPWIGRGLRSIVVSRAMLEVLDDRALIGLLTQTASPVWSGCVAGELVVWLGNLPLLCAWLVSRGIALIGRPLAVVVGASLVLPLLLCPFGFTRWVGRLLGAMLVGLFGTALVSAGLAGAGLGLLLSWAAVPAVRALLAWEGRRTERTADQATIEAGLGSQLLEALETLTWAEPVPGPAGVLRLLNRSGAPLACRAEIVFRSVSQS